MKNFNFHPCEKCKDMAQEIDYEAHSKLITLKRGDKCHAPLPFGEIRFDFAKINEDGSISVNFECIGQYRPSCKLVIDSRHLERFIKKA